MGRRDRDDDDDEKSEEEEDDDAPGEKAGQGGDGNGDVSPGRNGALAGEAAAEEEEEIEDEGTRAGAVRIVFEEGMDSSLKDLRYSIVQKTMRQ